ncbi:MAG: hypothetical protein KJZ86_16010 [Caldilineaceae bacterium]|nr:hypothetical protein [Caldilineaceae bacterium]
MPIIEQDFLELTRSLDAQAFWAENELCQTFTTAKPRCSLSFSPDDHWIFEFAPASSTIRYYQDKAYRDDLHRQVNQVTQAYVGKTFFDEDTWQHSPKRIENLFGCEFLYLEGSTPWLTPETEDPDEFARILDRAEATDLESWSFPDAFLREWEEREKAGKVLPKLGTGSRGPATIITSIIHPETAFYWMFDHPALMARLTELLAEKMIEFNRILRRFSANSEAGWWITDDNSALFNPELYLTYCFPVLERVLNALAPGTARRYQHSDSAMGHLLDQQYALGIRDVNYGPTVDAGLIREKMPDAWIQGQLPPFLLRNGSAEEIRARIVEDFRKAGARGGMNITTAGSLAAGTGVGRMRWMMQVVQDECRFSTPRQKE